MVGRHIVKLCKSIYKLFIYRPANRVAPVNQAVPVDQAAPANQVTPATWVASAARVAMAGLSAMAVMALLLAPAAILSSCTKTAASDQEIDLPAQTPEANLPERIPEANLPEYTSPESEYIPAEYTDTLKCLYYDDKSFRRSIANAAGNITIGLDSLPKEIRGGVVPHHLLADELIASFFNLLSEKEPELIIILAPNHTNTGNYKVSTSYSSWETPFGMLLSDNALVETLVSERIAGINRDIFEEDHSVSALIPYIKYYMPDSKVVPLLLHGDYSLEKSMQLGNRIAQLVDGKEYVILASVDFSHYLTGEAADKMDEITLDAIKRRDLKMIRKMNNDNLDSPPSIITLLSAMNAMKAEDLTVLGHSNSDKITGTSAEETTSYFTMLFY